MQEDWTGGVTYSRPNSGNIGNYPQTRPAPAEDYSNIQGNTGYSAGDTDNPFSGYRSFEQFRSNRKDDNRDSTRISRDVESNKYSGYQRKSSNSYSSSNKYSSGYNSGGGFFKTLAFKVLILCNFRLQLWRFWLQFWQQLWIRCEEGE